MELDDPRLRLCCGLLAVALLAAPFLYICLEDGVPSAPKEVEPAEGSIERVDWLLDREKDPDAALAAARELLAAGPAPEDAGLVKDALCRALEGVYGARAEKGDWAACEAVREELVRDHKGTGSTDRVDRQWLQDLRKWASAALAAGDLDLAGRVAAKILAHRDWRPISWDDPYFEVVSKLWRREMTRNVDAAGRILEDPLADRRFRQGALRLQKEHREYLEQAFRMAADSGDRATADRRFDRLVAALEGNDGLDLGPSTDYLSARLRDLVAAGKDEEADSLFQTLDRVAAGASTTKEAALRPIYTALRAARGRRALEAGDFAAAEAIFTERAPYPYYVDGRGQARQEAEYRIDRWRRERAAGRPEEAVRQLEAVLDRLADQLEPEVLAAALREEWPPETILARGDALLENGNADGALACFRVLSAGEGLVEGLADRIDRCQLESARAAAAGGSRWVDFASFARAERLYEGLLFESESFRADRARWRSAAVALFEVELEWARRAADNDRPEPAEEALDRAVRRTAVEIWLHDLAEPGADLWAGVPEDVRERVRSSAPGAGDAELRDALAELARRGKWNVPQAETAKGTAGAVAEACALAQVEDAWMHLEWPARHADSVVTFQKVVRKYPGSKASERVRQLLVEQIGLHRRNVEFAVLAGSLAEGYGAESFTRLCEYLAFFVAEFGRPAAGDPFRDELRESLGEAADVAGRTSPLARAFLLSLLADALPDEDAGRKAREEALRIGLSVVSDIELREERTPESEFPSLVEGYSVIAVENQMPYHVLIFCKGPETFYARLDPYSRGSIVLANGRYETAAIVPTGEVRPYHGQAEYPGVVRAERYVIEASEGGLRYDPKDLTSDFRIVRSPEGLGELCVQPETGLVVRRDR